MDLLRIYYPKLVGETISILVIWLVVWAVIRLSGKSLADHDKKAMYKGARWFTLLIFVIAVLHVLMMSSLNNVPRSDIDKSSIDKQTSSFEERMKSMDTVKH